MRLFRSSHRAAAALGLAALAAGGVQAQFKIPKVEDMANMFLTAAGTAEALNQAEGGQTLSTAASDSEVWSAFLTAASKGLEGSSLQAYANKFTDVLQGGDASSIINSAVPGEEASTSSLTTLNLGIDINKQLGNIKDSATMALGLTPEELTKENVGDAAWWGKTIFQAVRGGGDSFKVDCAWTASASYETANLFFPDAQSIYHVMFFPQFGPGDVAMIEGEFPDARYFSVQSYDDTFSPIAVMRDFEIDPYIGVNHFAKKGRTELRGGRFKIFLTKDGKRGLPNELAMSAGNYSSTTLGSIILRLYGLDPLADTKNPQLKNWGYKSPPTISLKSSGSVTPTSWDQGWQKLDQCPPENVATANQAVNTAVDSRIAEVSFTGDALACRIENVKDGFMLMSRERSSQSRSPFINADGSYLMACANARKNYIKNNDLIGVVRSYFPSTPYSKYQARFVGSPESYELRYASLSVYDLKPPGPVLRTLSDSEIREFYYNKYGAQRWEEEFGRNVSFIISTSETALNRCKVDTSDSVVMSLEGLSEDGQSYPEWFGVIYRELIPQSLRINETNAASYGMKPSEIYRKSVLDAREVMCPPGQPCDSNPYRAASIMKERFPRVEWYTCSPTGVLAVADPVMAVQYDTRYDSKATAPRAQQYFYQYCPEEENEVLVKVYAPSTTIVQAENQAPKAAPANTINAYAMKISAKDPVFVVGVSVKAKDSIDAYFKGEIEACGYSFITDNKWTCTSHPPADDSWLSADFDDSKWERASWISDDYSIPEISDDAKYITIQDPSVAIYCRLVVPNPTYME